MMVEITAPRILGPFFGSSSHVWTAVIGVILAALSVGYYVGGRLADRWPNPSLLCGIVMGGCVLTALIPFVAPRLGQWLLPPGIGLDRAHTLMKFGSLVTSLCIFFPPAMLLAVVGPFTIRCIACHDRLGRSAGTVYALGAVGSILGSFLPTFLFIPWLGSRKTILLATLVLFVVALAGVLMHRNRAVSSSGST